MPLNPCVIPPLVSYSVCDKVKNSWSKVADMDEKWLKYFCVFGGKMVKMVIFFWCVQVVLVSSILDGFENGQVHDKPHVHCSTIQKENLGYVEN